MSVKFADKACSERMAIVQSCQVKMIKNEANIVRLALFAQQTWGGWRLSMHKGPDFNGIREIFKTNRETWRSARKPGDSRENRETWQL